MTKNNKLKNISQKPNDREMLAPLKLVMSYAVLEGIAVTVIYVTPVMFDALLWFYQIAYVFIEIT